MVPPSADDTAMRFNLQLWERGIIVAQFLPPLLGLLVGAAGK